ASDGNTGFTTSCADAVITKALDSSSAVNGFLVMRFFPYFKYFDAKSMKAGQLGAGVWPYSCWRNATSPPSTSVPTGGKTVVPMPLAPSNSQAGLAATSAMNMPLASTHPSPGTYTGSSSVDPAPTKIGLGAISARNSCSSNGISAAE